MSVSRFRNWLFLVEFSGSHIGDNEEYSLLGCTLVDAHRRFGESYWLQFQNRRVNEATCRKLPVFVYILLVTCLV
jgi:hypothetical protein